MNKFYLCKERSTYSFEVKSSEELQKFIPGQEYHSTINYFDEDILGYMTAHKGSPAGYAGKRYGENFVIDVDQPELKREGKLLAARVCKWLVEHNLVYFQFTSGCKGYHWHIPADQIEIPEEAKSLFNIANRALRDLIAKDIRATSQVFMMATREVAGKKELNIPKLDEQIYSPLSTIRFPFSKHPKGTRKMNVQYKGHDEGNFNETSCFELINDSRCMQQMFNSHVKYQPVMKLDVDTSHAYKVSGSSDAPKTTVIPYNQPICMFRMKDVKDSTGNRRMIGMRLISFWRGEGKNKGECESLLRNWSKGLTFPLEEKELMEVMQTFDGMYLFSCKDTLKSQFCSPTCTFFNVKETDADHVWMAGSHAKNFQEFKASMSKVEGAFTMDISLLYPKIKVMLNAMMGQVLTLCGASGTGKTTLLVQFMLFYKHLNWLVFSYDMTKEEIIERMMITMKLDYHSDAHCELFDRTVTNIDIIDDTEILLHQVEAHKTRMEKMSGKRYHIMVYDYLDYIPAEGVKDDFARNSLIAKSLRKVSKRTKTIQVMLVQVPKEKGGNGNIPLGMDAPANASNITNVSHAMLTFWRPNKGLASRPDNIFRVRVAKYRAGQADYDTDLEFVGASYLIRPWRTNATGNQTGLGGSTEDLHATRTGVQNLLVPEGPTTNTADEAVVVEDITESDTENDTGNQDGTN